MTKFFTIGISILVIGGITASYVLLRPEESPYEFGYAERRDIRSLVSVTGRVVPAREVQLAFESAGRIEHIAVATGNRMQKGSLLITQDRRELSSQLAEQQAVIKIKEAELSALQRGTRAEKIRVDEITAENKRVALQDAREDLVNKMRGAFTKTDDAVHNLVDQLYTNPRTSPQLDKFNITSFALQAELETARLDIELLLKDWDTARADFRADETVLDAARAVKNDLDESILFLERIAFMVNGLQEGSYLTQATLDGYKADIATARTNVNTAAVNLTAAAEKVRSAMSALLLAEEELALAKAGTAAEDVAAAAAGLEQAIAKAATIETRLAQKTLYAPISGIITAVAPHVGEFVSAGTVVVSLISDAMFTIEAHVPEVDIAGVAAGKKADVTLDAYGRNERFSAVVASVDPAETIIEGVATYKITLGFPEHNDRIKSGMTANIDIINDTQADVVAVPSRAVGSTDAGEIVLVRRGSAVVESSVITGLRGSDGFIEIIEGVGEGEEIVVFVRE